MSKGRKQTPSVPPTTPSDLPQAVLRLISGTQLTPPRKSRGRRKCKKALRKVLEKKLVQTPKDMDYRSAVRSQATGSMNLQIIRVIYRVYLTLPL